MGIYSNGTQVISAGKITAGTPELGYFKRKQIGSRPDYLKAVIPLVNVDNSQIDRFSYTSGRLEMIRTNGCCYQGVVLIDFKMQKNYNSTGYHWTEIHVSRGSADPCKFTYNGQLWAGIHHWYNVQAHDVYFTGFSTEALDLGYLTYYNVNSSTVTNSEIYNSLVIG